MESQRISLDSATEKLSDLIDEHLDRLPPEELERRVEDFHSVVDAIRERRVSQ